MLPRTCKKNQPLLSRLLDRDLSLSATHRLTQHLEHCWHCQQALLTLTELKQSLATLPKPNSNRGIQQRILTRVRIRSTLRKKQKPTWRPTLITTSAIAMASAFGLVLFPPRLEPAHTTLPATIEVASLFDLHDQLSEQKISVE
jgi:anti-sigma factor RsiW